LDFIERIPIKTNFDLDMAESFILMSLILFKLRTFGVIYNSNYNSCIAALRRRLLVKFGKRLKDTTMLHLLVYLAIWKIMNFVIVVTKPSSRSLSRYGSIPRNSKYSVLGILCGTLS
jgi:hypothetical protein